MFSSVRRIKAPERGLLAMHPFVDVLEGRSLFTATAHDGVMDVTLVLDASPAEDAVSPWSNEPITAGESIDTPEDGALSQLLAQTTPGRIELKPQTSGSAFAADTTIGDTAWTLFGNALWDRRGQHDPFDVPTDEQITAARIKHLDADEDESPFVLGRPMTGAMAPYLMMSVEHADHPFIG
jgi:hypothetical protein